LQWDAGRNHLVVFFGGGTRERYLRLVFLDLENDVDRIKPTYAAMVRDTSASLTAMPE